MKSSCSLIALFWLLMSCQTSHTNTESGVDASAESLYPQYHMAPASQWMNDPNGMVYYAGEYHLFYQHYPDSNVWGPMHWAHAVSPDMVHWEHLPIALYPDNLGYIFSGSAVMDEHNTSGFGSAENPAMVAIFTYHHPKGAEAGKVDFQTQGLAYSLDKGRTWTKYEDNPVVENPGIIDFRDPKVSWNEELRQWVMVLAVKDHVSIYTSPNLKDWEHASDFGAAIGAHGGVWECPDLFALKDENTGEEKWVMLVSINPGGPNGGSATQYFVGDFDGKTFTPDDTETRWMDYGPDNYAGVTWANVPESDGRRLLVGWMNNWKYANIVPTEEWRGAMTIPRELVLEGMTLKSLPVTELKALQSEPLVLDLKERVFELPSSLVNLYMDVDPEKGNQFQLVFSNGLGEELVVSYAGEIAIDRSRAGISNFHNEFARRHEAPLNGNMRNLELYMDKASVEVFANDGATVMTSAFFPNEPYNKLEIRGDQEMLTSISGHVLSSIWGKKDQKKGHEQHASFR